jgi:hypothetical protein
MSKPPRAPFVFLFVVAALSYGACSDGVSFWITLAGSFQLARF